jgi:hypothetical protein
MTTTFFILLFAFGCGFALDAVWIKCIACVQTQRAVAAANLSVLLYICTVVSTLVIVDKNTIAVAAYALGGWIGTYFTVEKKK